MFRTLINNTRSVAKIIQRNSSGPSFWSELQNGVRVVSEQVCSDLACLSMLVDVGSKYEIPCNNGMTYFIERMAYQGFNGTRKCDLEYKIKCIGARLDCKTTKEYQIFTATFPAACLPDMLNIFSKIIDNNLDLSTYIECAKAELCNELIDVENDPKKLCFDYLHSSAFQGTPLALPVIGPYKNYQRFTSSYTYDFIHTYYYPSRVVLSLSGPWSHKEFTSMAFDTFGHLQDQNCKKQPTPARFTGSQVMFRHDGMPFSHNIIAVEAPGMLSSKYLEFRTLVEILGSWDKSQGTEYRTWPEAAQYSAMADLCESYEAFYIPYKDVGLFGIYFVASNGKHLDDMFENIQNQLMKVCTCLSESEFARGVNRLRLKIAQEAQGCFNSSIDQAVQMSYLGLKKNVYEQWEELKAVQRESVVETANNYMYDRCVVCASVGPTESVPDYNRIRAGMYWLRV